MVRITDVHFHNRKGVDPAYLLLIVLVAIIVFLTIFIIVQGKTNLGITLAQEISKILGGG